MSKKGKILLLILFISVALVIGAYFFIGAVWGGAFNSITPNEIATYNSPNEKYSLVFEQMGDPAWPFGPTDVRLTLKDHDGKIIRRVSTRLFNDGVNAGEHNVASVTWGDNAVVVVFKASEMENKEVSISYSKG